MKTFSIKPSEIEKKWILLNAEGVVLGRLAAKIATILRGKNKPTFTPHMDMGDNVIVINSDKVKMTGKKWKKKKYISHSGYPGGQKVTTPNQLKEKKSSKFIIEKAVRGMLPKNRLGRDLFRNLYVYEDSKHPHQGQNPKEIKL